MINSTYGVKLPENGDTGAPVFNAMNSNFEYLRDHIHDGSTGTKINMAHITKETVNIDSGAWVATGDGRGFVQTVTCPGLATLLNSVVRFRIRTGGDTNKVIHPSIVPVSVTQFTITVNDSSLNLEALFA